MNQWPSQATHRLLSAANTTNATVVKAKPGSIDSICGFNAGAITYLKIYDKATTPDETDTPRLTLYLAANLMFDFPFGRGINFANGIAYRMTTAAADNSTAAVASAAVLALNVNYS
jgi:hypothetical protein